MNMPVVFYGYVNGQGVHTDGFEGVLPREAAAGKGRDETAASSAADTVMFSEEGREAAERMAKESVDGVAPTPPSEEKFSYRPVRKSITGDGTEVSIEAAYAKDKNGHNQATSVQVHFTGKDGDTYSHVLRESSILTQDENGRWQVARIDGAIAVGTDQDDIIILLPDDKPLSGVTENGIVIEAFSDELTTQSVDAGEGNNLVMDFSGGKTRITTGSGNDTIVGSSVTGRYVVDSGAGDDSIELTGNAAYVYAGDGDDVLTLATDVVRAAYGGAGNDTLRFEAGINVDAKLRPDENGIIDLNTYRPRAGEGIVDGGDGDDVIEFKGNANGTILGGNGNDTIEGHGDGSTAYIDGGAGDDLIKGQNLTGGNQLIIGGGGNDTIDVRGSNGGTTYIAGGNGNDDIYLGGGSSTVFGGDGNDYIEHFATGGTTFIDGGAGEDTINMEVTGGYHYATGGADDDLMYANLLGGSSTVTGGAGNDHILLERTQESMTREKLKRIVADRKEKKRADEVSGSEDLTDYEKQISEAAMGLRREENANSPAGSADNEIEAAVRKAVLEEVAAIGLGSVGQVQRALRAYGRYM